MNTPKRLAIAACAIVGLGTLAWAEAPTSTPHSWHAAGAHAGMRHGPLQKALKELDLTPEQKQQVHSILQTAHTQAGNSSRPDITVLANPGDPNYAAAVQQAKTSAANRVQHMSDITQQIYAVLTSEQKAKLPQVLEAMKAKFEQRREQWRNSASSAS